MIFSLSYAGFLQTVKKYTIGMIIIIFTSEHSVRLFSQVHKFKNVILKNILIIHILYTALWDCYRAVTLGLHFVNSLGLPPVLDSLLPVFHY